MQNERCLITYPTWKKYVVLSKYIEQLRVRDKRQIFQIMRRTNNLTESTFFPFYGFTAGEFSVWQGLSENRKSRRTTKKNASDTLWTCEKYMLYYATGSDTYMKSLFVTPGFKDWCFWTTKLVGLLCGDKSHIWPRLKMVSGIQYCIWIKA